MEALFKSITILLLFTVNFLVLPHTVHGAKELLLSKEELQSMNFSGYETINPNSLLYQFKRVGEQIKLKFTSNEKKINYEFELLETRFNELVFIINFQKTGFLEETALRYNSFLGHLKESKQKIPPEKHSKYIKILESLRDKYPSNSAYWLSIQQTIDSTNGLI